MKFYEKIYINLCESRKSNIINYGYGSNIHKHHITPRHSGGTDIETNLTYLSIREHILAHFLLWKIFKIPNDLRSMKMLGARLSSSHRREIGIFCKNNNIGIWGATKEERREWTRKGVKTQKSRQIGIHDPIAHKEYARLGGKASFQSGNNKKFLFWASKEGRKARSSLGGKANLGKKCMYRPGDPSFIRVPPEKLKEFEEKGYIYGSPINPRLKKKPSS